jgi:two-component system invasion response regulator UvrY
MKLLIVDDHTVVREGLRRLLSNSIEAEIFDAGSSEAAQAVFLAEKPEAIILDLNLPGPGGLDLLKRVLAEAPQTRVLIFSMHANPTYVLRAMQAGALGYVTKSASADELLAAVRSVMNGTRYLQRDLVADLAASPVWTQGPKQTLSSRELDIMRLLAQGLALTQIAAQLGVSYKTIANTCTVIKDKLAVRHTSDLIRVALEMHSRLG